MFLKRSLTTVGLLFAAIASHAASPAAVVSADEVSAALRARSIDIASRQIQFLADVPMRASSALEVLAIEPSTKDRSLVRLRCRERQSCIPFYVSVKWESAEQKAANLAAWKPEVHAQVVKPVVKPAPLVIHAGEQATLLITGEQLQMKLPVQCLESGKAGSQIRVRTKDGKKIYRAEVVGPNSVRINM